jgi:hypothetical protein
MLSWSASRLTSRKCSLLAASFPIPANPAHSRWQRLHRTPIPQQPSLRHPDGSLPRHRRPLLVPPPPSLAPILFRFLPIHRLVRWVAASRMLQRPRPLTRTSTPPLLSQRPRCWCLLGISHPRCALPTPVHQKRCSGGAPSSPRLLRRRPRARRHLHALHRRCRRARVRAQGLGRLLALPWPATSQVRAHRRPLLCARPRRQGALLVGWQRSSPTGSLEESRAWRLPAKRRRRYSRCHKADCYSINPTSPAEPALMSLITVAVTLQHSPRQAQSIPTLNSSYDLEVPASAEPVCPHWILSPL